MASSPDGAGPASACAGPPPLDFPFVEGPAVDWDSEDTESDKSQPIEVSFSDSFISSDESQSDDAPDEPSDGPESDSDSLDGAGDPGDVPTPSLPHATPPAPPPLTGPIIITDDPVKSPPPPPPPTPPTPPPTPPPPPVIPTAPKPRVILDDDQDDPPPSTEKPAAAGPADQTAGPPPPDAPVSEAARKKEEEARKREERRKKEEERVRKIQEKYGFKAEPDRPVCAKAVTQDIRVSVATSPAQVFGLIFDEELWTLMLVQTNLYREQKEQLGDVTMDELKTFVGIMIHMTLRVQPTINSYWSQDPEYQDLFVSNAMSRTRWYSILMTLHFVDKNETPVCLVWYVRFLLTPLI